MNLVNNSETTCLVKVRNLVILVNLKVAMIVKAALTGILYYLSMVNVATHFHLAE